MHDPYSFRTPQDERPTGGTTHHAAQLAPGRARRGGGSSSEVGGCLCVGATCATRLDRPGGDPALRQRERELRNHVNLYRWEGFEGSTTMIYVH